MCGSMVSKSSLPVREAVTASPMQEMQSHASAGSASHTVLHLTDIHIGAEYDAPRYSAKLLCAILRLHPQVRNVGYGVTRPSAHLSEVELIKAMRKLPAVYSLNCETSLWISSLERASENEGWTILAFEGCDPSDEDLRIWLRQIMASVPLNHPLILISRVPFPLGTDFSQRHAPVVALHGEVHFQSDQSIWNVQFQCYGSVSGIGSREEAQRGIGLQRSVADYSLLSLWPDGRSECSYRSISL